MWHITYISLTKKQQSMKKIYRQLCENKTLGFSYVTNMNKQYKLWNTNL